MSVMLGLNIKPWCTCMATGNWLRQDGYTLDRPSGLWVHGRCRKPSKMNYDRMVLGLEQIPQPKREEDIYAKELEYEARKVIVEELSWTDDEDEDDMYDSWSIAG